MQKELLDGFQLREFQIDPLTRTVSSARGSSHLGSKSVEVLLKLAERPHSLVSRQELLERVWGDAGTSAESLNAAISELRHALADDHQSPMFIQTVPRRGYRLLVEPAFGAQQPATQGSSEPFFADLLRRGVIQAGLAFLLVGWAILQVLDVVGPNLGLPAWTRPFATYVVIGGLPVVLALAWFFEYAEGRFYVDRGKTAPGFMAGLQKNYLSIFAAYIIALGSAAIYQAAVGFPVPGGLAENTLVDEELIPIEPNSIAVLRFMNIDGSERTEVFSHGLAEDVLDRLARVPGLLVSARGDSWSLPVNSVSTDVRERLRVAYYLEGSVRITDDNLRVVAQLIDSERGVHIVSRSFDRKLEDFMEVQREITNLTIANLRVALPEETQMIMAGEYDGPEVDAYVLYRRGKELLDQPANKNVLMKAIDYFRQALMLDPGYAAAHAGLCRAYTNRYVSTNDAQFIARAERACSAGMADSSNLHMVYTAAGNLYSQTGNLAQAESAYLKAIDINAQDVDAMQGLAAVYERQQKLDDAVKLISEAIHLQPGNWQTLNSLGRLYFVNGMYAEAAEAYARVVSLASDNSRGHGNLGSSLMMIGDFDGAARALQRSIALEPRKTYYSNLGIIYYYLGRFDESVSFHRQAIEESPDQNYVWLNLGDALLFSSEPSEAAAAFRRSSDIAEGMLEVDPGNAGVMYELAWARAMLGNIGAARELIDRSKAIDPDNPYVHYYDALISVREGRNEMAVDALQKAVNDGYPAVMLATEPHLKRLRDVPDFRRLVANID